VRTHGRRDEAGPVLAARREARKCCRQLRLDRGVVSIAHLFAAREKNDHCKVARFERIFRFEVMTNIESGK
jgi:hypothetical protein